MEIKQEAPKEDPPAQTQGMLEENTQEEKSMLDAPKEDPST